MFSPLIILLIASGIGFFSTLIQIVLFRELIIVLEGNELSLALLLCWWLLGVSLGALIPRRLIKKSNASHWLIIILLLIPLIFIACVAGVRLSPMLFSLPPEEYPSPILMFTMVMTCVFPSGFVIGFLFPVLSSCYDQSTISGDAFGIGSVFAFEALGSVICGLWILFFRIYLYDPFLLHFTLGF